MNDSDFWKMKLAAFLHDPPQKQLDLVNHEGNARRTRSVAGLGEEENHEARIADQFDSAAERFAFPKGKCAHDFVKAPLFIHPLSSEPLVLSSPFTARREELSGAIQTAVGGMENDDWHKKFFLYWRRWLTNVTQNDPNMAFLPADSRIPDHSIWTHMSVVSALAPCAQGDTIKPELLLFQLAPVQEFIAQARTARDLWSGSYLISWLMANAIKAVSDEIGPDAVIFPNLRGNGIFDVLHKDTMYAEKWRNPDGTLDTIWQRILSGDFKGDVDKMADWLMTPTLPNRFLAVVPAGRGAELAGKAEAALRSELAQIGEHVWKKLTTYQAKEEWKQRWNEQIKAFPQIAWATQGWLERDACLSELSKLSQDKGNETTVSGRLHAVLDAAGKLPDADKNPCYFTADGKLKNSGLLWSAHYALLDAKLAARRNTRDFAQWDPVAKDAAVKDSLSGKEECIGDDNNFWKNLSKDIFSAKEHRYGALNLIKRLWCLPEAGAYLVGKLGLPLKAYEKGLRISSLEEIAKNSKDTYIAVLAMDGDEMGKWISGAKTPKFFDQLAPEAKSYLSRCGHLRRLLTPAYHLQFSEALANFAMYRARSIVESNKGQLIYAGGDDVLAVLPAKRAIECARELRNAFRLDYGADGKIYPGSKSEVSVGLAFGHIKAPLQMLVKEAQNAEHDAKTRYDRAAMAVRLYKRSGEIIHWGCKWKGGAIDLMQEITQLTEDNQLSGRFPYALAERLQPYGAYREDLIDIIKFDVADVLKHQGENIKTGRDELVAKIGKYLDSISESTPSGWSGGHRYADFLNLFLAETFINRNRGEE